MADRASLTSCPKAWETAIQNWLGPRSYRLNSNRRDVFKAPWTAIVMSHRHRHPELSAYWRLAVERSLQYCRASHSFLLASDNTPLGPFLIQAAKRVQIPVVQLRFPLPRESHCDWEQRVRTSDINSRSEDCETQLWISPLDESLVSQEANFPSEPSTTLSTDFETLPLVDRALIALADRVRVISIAAGSKTERLIRLRLEDARFPTASVFVALDTVGDQATDTPPDQSKRKLASRNLLMTTIGSLLDGGAVGWFHSPRVDESLIDQSNSVLDREQFSFSAPISPHISTLVPFFAFKKQSQKWSEAWPYLSHCTRARTGAWPDQSQVGYYDSLIASRNDFDQNATAFDTLKRILVQQRLIASSDLNRSGLPTVSLTQVSLQTLLPRRQFQSHLGRWDWESYGICIDRRWVEQNGGRRVLYSNTAKWGELSSQDRPFFQPTRDSENPDRSEWKSEQEWRVIGDIHLATIPFESAFVFVPSKEEAAQIASISRFPIMVLEN